MLVLPALSALAASVVVQAQYAPTYVQCPADVELVRNSGSVLSGNQRLHPDEAAYVAARREGPAREGYATFLSSVNASLPANVVLPSYVTSILTASNASALPKIAFAASGGGYRATIFGAGVLSAFDGRNATARRTGTGGLLQAADRLAGLSGGSWLVTSLAQANFPSIQTLAFGPGSNATLDDPATSWNGWNANFDLLQPGGNNSAASTAIYGEILRKMGQKRRAGFDVTFGDFWALALAYHFINGTSSSNFFNSTSTSHGAGVTFSGITQLPTWQSHDQPFPIILTNTQSPGENRSSIIGSNAVPLQNTVYEISPLEMGSWDPDLTSFTPTALLGTTVVNGSAVNSSACVNGFDQAAFVTGTSSNLFVLYNITAAALAASQVGPFFQLINTTFGASMPQQQLDISAYPNPFFGLGTNLTRYGYLDSDETELRLLDGGLDGAVTPYQPLLVPARQTDVIIGIDAAADTATSYANGSSIIATQLRSRLPMFNASYPFPQVPKTALTYVSLGLTRRPTFFGCNETAAPLVIYLANSPVLRPNVTRATNTTTGKVQYSNTEVSTFLDQAFEIATRGYPSVNTSTNPYMDPMWPTCLACAVVDRQRGRMGVARDSVCNGCFARYCWSGIEVSPSNSSAPTSPTTSAARPSFASPFLGAAVVGGALALFSALL